MIQVPVTSVLCLLLQLLFYVHDVLTAPTFGRISDNVFKNEAQGHSWGIFKGSSLKLEMKLKDE